MLTDHTAYCAVGREAPWRCRVDKYVLNWSNTKVTFLKVKCEKKSSFSSAQSSLLLQLLPSSTIKRAALDSLLKEPLKWIVGSLKPGQLTTSPHVQISTSLSQAVWSWASHLVGINHSLVLGHHQRKSIQTTKCLLSNQISTSCVCGP